VTLVSAVEPLVGQHERPAGAQELLARVRELVPLLRANAERTERERRIAADSVAALRAAGLFRLTTPPEFGGYELSLPALLEIITEVGRGCASTGWIVANDAASTTFAYELPEAALKDIFGENPDALVLSSAGLASAQATRVDGGYVISGRFPWSSGCEISDWAYLSIVPVANGTEPPTGLISAMVPLSAVSIEDTWHCAGMAGTGTHTMIATDVFVPEHRTIFFDISPEAARDEDERTAEVIRGSLQSLAALVGAALGALDLVRAALDKKKPVSYTTYAAAVDSPAVRHWFAEATHLIDTAVLHMTHAGEKLDAVPHNQPVPWVERARIRAHLASCLARTREGLDKLLDVAGAGGFALANPVQRHWRDVNVGSRHNALNAPTIFEDYSRALLDVRPTVTLLY
jgi:3-hydroxy-9,10-secoandrosta-1,3,5(10)-triene-9,17-dione monooxygenase